MFAGKGERLAAERALDDPHGFDESVNPDPGRAEGEASHLVVDSGIASADAKLEAPVRQAVERRCISGHRNRVPERIGEHQAAHSQCRRGLCRDGEGGDGPSGQCAWSSAESVE